MDNEVFLPSEMIMPKGKDLFPFLNWITTFGRLRTVIGDDDDVCAVELRTDGVLDPDDFELYDDITEVPHAYDACKIVKSYYTHQKTLDTESKINKNHGFLKVTIEPLDDQNPYVDIPPYISQRIEFGE